MSVHCFEYLFRDLINTQYTNDDAITVLEDAYLKYHIQDKYKFYGKIQPSIKDISELLSFVVYYNFDYQNNILNEDPFDYFEHMFSSLLKESLFKDKAYEIAYEKIPTFIKRPIWYSILKIEELGFEAVTFSVVRQFIDNEINQCPLNLDEEIEPQDFKVLLQPLSNLISQKKICISVISRDGTKELKDVSQEELVWEINGLHAKNKKVLIVNYDGAVFRDAWLASQESLMPMSIQRKKSSVARYFEYLLKDYKKDNLFKGKRVDVKAFNRHSNTKSEILRFIKTFDWPITIEVLEKGYKYNDGFQRIDVPAVVSFKVTAPLVVFHILE